MIVNTVMSWWFDKLYEFVFPIVASMDFVGHLVDMEFDLSK
jgi:hypothetical protein